MNWSEIIVAILGVVTVLLGGGYIKFKRLWREVGELLDNPNQEEWQDVVDALKALLGR